MSDEELENITKKNIDIVIATKKIVDNLDNNLNELNKNVKNAEVNIGEFNYNLTHTINIANKRFEAIIANETNLIIENTKETLNNIDSVFKDKVDEFEKEIKNINLKKGIILASLSFFLGMWVAFSFNSLHNKNLLVTNSSTLTLHNVAQAQFLDDKNSVLKVDFK